MGVWAPWWILFCVFRFRLLCDVSLHSFTMFHISVRLWSYPVFTVHFECYECGSVQPPTQANMPLVAWLLSHPIFLESFEDTAFLDQDRRLSNLKNGAFAHMSVTWIVDQFCSVHPCIQQWNQPSYLDFVATHNFSSSQIRQFASEWLIHHACRGF